MISNNEKLNRFIELLKGIFELDKADLDFGIYRIMNIRKKEIEQFLTDDLPKKVRETLAHSATDTDIINSRIAEIEKQAKDLGIEINASPKLEKEYSHLKQQIDIGIDSSTLETDVYSALYNFFNRYYEEGDFISKRRYKEGVYAIPYEGEEVKLYWANADQYYIKTTENFRDYTFIADGKKIHFKIVEATTEQNNKKESKGKERIFLLYNETDDRPDIKTIEEIDDELIIRFIFDIPDDDKKSKKDYYEHNLEAIRKIIQKDFHNWWHTLLEKMSPTTNNEKRTILEKHLNAYVKKNEFDYFIHKDLHAFLTRELDFFIKSEVLHLDDIDTADVKRVDCYFTKIRAIKRVGKIIIDFLSQIEEFQKKLWLKKKFVVETNWCITLDRIDKKFYPEIISNKSQISEWEEMYAIDEIEGDLNNVGYSDLLRKKGEEFLYQNKNLILDTRHFTTDFKDRLIASIDNIDEQTNGLLIHSENFQALQLLQERYKEQVQTIYIDPPYNTVHSKIVYKNNYEHASWLCLLQNTMQMLPIFWTKNFSFGLAIDDYEFVKLAQLCDQTFPTLERSVVIVNHHAGGTGGRISRTHEYYILLSKSSSPSYLGEPLEDYQEDRGFMRSGTGENNFRYARWKSFYALLMDPKTRHIVDVEDPVPIDETYPTEPTNDGLIRIYPIGGRGEERVWRSSYLTGRERAKNGELTITSGGTVYQQIDYKMKREVLYSNWVHAKFNAGIQGSNLLRDMGLGGEFDYPKSIKTLETGLWAQTFGITDSIILDYFAGSGTTGHAVINLNREDKGRRKYILVEMGEYFDTVTLPRMKKVIYSVDWKNGKPTKRDTGISHIMKYIKLESYEDALSNIMLDEDKHKLVLRFGDEYMIHYMFNYESKDSMLSLDEFVMPFDYKLKINENNETKDKIVDLCETFNYLIGLSVIRQSVVEYFSAVPDPDKKNKYENAVKLQQNKNGEFGFKQIAGKLPDGKRVLIIWRNVAKDLLRSNAALDSYFSNHRINSIDQVDVVFVNGDNNLENLRLDDETWIVKRIEPIFKSKMFKVVK